MKTHKKILLIAALLGISSLHAQKRQGTVTNSQGETLPGVSVKVSGQAKGTVTDINGKYQLDVPDGALLEVSYIGYQTEQVQVSNQTTINVTLQESIDVLDEVQVIGYGVQRKSDVTGATHSIKTKDLVSVPTARVDEVLQGRIPGAFVQKPSGAPDAGPVIRIRGINSISASNEPLVVIDGLLGGNLWEIHPNDIKSFEVLKDASATAIYGSRGSNGVILVTTKDGSGSSLGRPMVSYNSYYSFNSIATKLDYLTAAQYARLHNEISALQSPGSSPVYSDAEIAAFQKQGGTQWENEIYRNTLSQNHNLSVRGRSKQVKYSLSVNYFDNPGIVIGPSSFQQFTFHPNVEVQLSPKFLVGAKVQIRKNQGNPVELNSRGATGSPVLAALVFPPTLKIYEADGTYTTPGGKVGKTDYNNPVGLAKEPIKNYENNSSQINAYISYSPIKGLTLKTIGIYRGVYSRSNSYDSRKQVNGDSKTQAGASIGTSQGQFLQTTNMVSYEKSFSGHSFQLTAVYEIQKDEGLAFSGSKQGFLTNATAYHNIQFGEKNASVASSESTQVIESVLGRLNYSYQNKYLLTLSARNDGSSVFGANNKRAFFPSAAIGWNLAKEPFLKNNLSLFNVFKIRASYGETGNQAIGAYQSLSKLVTGVEFDVGEGRKRVGFDLPKQRPNPDLKWETTSQVDVGMDFHLFRSRLYMTFDYYDKKTTDLLQVVKLTPETGYETELTNIGEVGNWGIDFLVGGSPIDHKGFRWTSEWTLSLNRNEVRSLNTGQKEQDLGSAGFPAFDKVFALQVGKPIGLIKGHRFLGVWQSNEASEAAKYKDANDKPFEPGDPKYEDKDGNGIIDGKDVFNIGNPNPSFVFGWNNTFTYKGIELNVFMQGTYGNEIYNLGRYIRESVRFGTPTSSALLDRWTPQNGNNKIPSLKGDFARGIDNDSRWIEDGSYLRLKNITLAYNLPASILEGTKVLRSVRIYGSITNLYTWTKYSGYDPEAATGRDAYAGVDIASYPSQRNFVIGLNIGF